MISTDRADIARDFERAHRIELPETASLNFEFFVRRHRDRSVGSSACGATLLFQRVAMPLFNTPSTVLLQQKVEENFLGRVFGVLGMISSSMMPLGMLVFGPIADFIKIEWLLIGTGLLLFVLGLFLLGNKVLIEAGKPVKKP